ncbi:MAG: hypothetical protein SCM11_12870 [Bacillota bacterium]|nr:hypothetical protein [Bacillota bacterium]
MLETIKNRIDLHRSYWLDDHPDRFLSSFRIGDYFFASKFRAATLLLKPGLTITPDMIRIDDFRADYERLFAEAESIGQSGFWVAEPFTAIPWMEAILGCRIIAGSESFIAQPPDVGNLLSDSRLDQCLNADILHNNPWFETYIAFTERLVEWSQGRFPVGQPILRGISDMLGALLGQTEMIYALYDEPEKIAGLATGATELFLSVVQQQFSRIPPFGNGYSIGFYHVWTPGRCIWFQDDLSALLSPDLFSQFVLPHIRAICKGYDFSAMHLHAASFQHLDAILLLDQLKAVEINKDIGGPSIQAMLPIFHKIVSQGKRLIIWGALDLEDLQVIRQELTGQPVFLNIVADSVGLARHLQAALDC